MFAVSGSPCTGDLGRYGGRRPVPAVLFRFGPDPSAEFVARGCNIAWASSTGTTAQAQRSNESVLGITCIPDRREEQGRQQARN